MMKWWNSANFSPELSGSHCANMVFCWSERPFYFMNPWHQWLLPLDTPTGMLYFSSLASLSAFIQTKERRIAKPFFLLSVICANRSISNSNHTACFPQFARLSRDIFCKSSLLLCHSLTWLSDTPNLCLAAWFPFCLTNLTICSLSETVLPWHFSVVRFVATL